jgi:hypothetical protein
MKRYNITLWLLVVDWLVLLLFVFIGQRDHNITGTAALPSLMATTQALAIPWTVVASAWGVAGIARLADASSGGMARHDWFGRVLTAWLIAAPIGLIFRALGRGQSTISVPFMVVTLGVGGLFILVWRAIVWWAVVYRAGSKR